MNLESPFFNVLSALDIALKIGTQTPHSHEASLDSLMSILKLFQSLLEEFEKYNENNPSLGYTSLAVLNRLERVFRKTASVLDNCCKPGRRVYNIIRFPVMLKSFSDVVEEMEECMSCPPFSNVRGSVSLCRQVDALTSKLKETSFTVDPTTQMISNEMELMVMQRKRGMSPGPALIRRLGKQFDFRSIEAIREEDRMLAQERSVARMTRNHMEEEFLSNVAAILAGIRPEDLDANRNQHQDSRHKSPWAVKSHANGTTSGSPVSPSPSFTSSSPSASPSPSNKIPPVPSEFICPLSLEIMTDPVIVASGQTYERTCIRRWFDKDNNTCPITRQKLEHDSLIPNFALKSSIASWCASQGVSMSEAGVLILDSNKTSPYDAVTPSPGNHASIASPSASETSDVVRDLSGLSPILDGSKSLDRNASANSSPEMKSSLRPIVSRRTVRSSLRASAEGSSTQSSPDPSAYNSQTLTRTSSLCESHSQIKAPNFTKSFSLTSSPASSVEFFALGVQPSIPSHAKTDSLSEDAMSVVSGHSALRLNGNGYASQENGSRLKRTEEEEVSVSGDSNSSLGSSALTPNRNEEEAAAKKTKEPEVLEGEEKLTADEIVIALNSMNAETRYKAAIQVRRTTKSSERNRKLIASAGAIKPLLSLLRHSDVRLVHSAIFALLNLSVSDVNKLQIVTRGGVSSFVKLLANPDEEIREGACAVLFSLSFIDNCKLDIAESGAVPLLLQILEEGSNLGKEDALCTLYNLSISGKNRWILVRESVIKKIVSLLSDPTFCSSCKAVSILSNLCTISEGRDSLVECGGIPVLAEMVEYGDPKSKEDAAAALLLLCKNETHRALIWKEDVLSPLMILSNKGTARAKVKAKALLQQLNSRPA